MGFLAWMARRGTVGGTARWAGKSYKKILDSNPDAKHEEILSFLIEHRYGENSQNKQAVYSTLNSMKQMSMSGELGLKDLVASVLIVEAGLTGNSDQNISLFNRIIQEELSKLNLTPNIIYGEEKGAMMKNFGINTL